MHYAVLFVAALGASFATRSVAIPTSSSLIDWTYGDAYLYAIENGGNDDPVARLIANHVNSTGRQWTEKYQDDIKDPSSGSIMTLSNSARGRAMQNYYGGSGNMTLTHLSIEIAGKEETKPSVD